jgi:hypothetical protein
MPFLSVLTLLGLNDSSLVIFQVSLASSRLGGDGYVLDFSVIKKVNMRSTCLLPSSGRCSVLIY